MIQKFVTNNAQRYASKWLVLFIDLITVAFSFILSYLIRFNLTLNFEVEKLVLQLPLVIGAALVSFIIVGSYKGVVRHTGVRDVYNIFNAICLSSIMVIFIVMANGQFSFLPQFTIPIAIIIVNSLIGFIGLTSSRYVFKSLYNQISGDLISSKNVLIYGAGDSGILTYGALTNHSKGNVKVIGYIDRDQKKVGKRINGVPVFTKEI
jgi:FlaA1/EpsC-like NDP-sugar epimerase